MQTVVDVNHHFTKSTAGQVHNVTVQLSPNIAQSLERDSDKPKQ